MTDSISRNAFFYGMTQSLGETAIAATLTTARYSVLAYDLVTSEEARQTYRWVKVMGIALGQLAFWSTVWAWVKVQRWAEAEVQTCLPPDPDHIPDAGKMVEADPFAPDENPAYATVPAAITAPVATLVVKAEPAAQTVTSAELRRQCQDAGIKWRNAHGKGRHLSKGEMIAALQEMDCWALSEGCLA